VSGEFDAAAVPTLTEVMTLAPDTEPGDITIDLTGVSFIDAAALGYLVGFANHLAARGAKLSVVSASPRLRRVFDIVQLGGLLQTT
jgi:anti-anti-sigma factor